MGRLTLTVDEYRHVAELKAWAAESKDGNVAWLVALAERLSGMACDVAHVSAYAELARCDARRDGEVD